MRSTSAAHFSENAANVSSLRRASSMANISSSRHVFCEVEQPCYSMEVHSDERYQPRTEGKGQSENEQALLRTYENFVRSCECVFHSLHGPFRQDSARTRAASTSTCLSVNRLSAPVVMRFCTDHRYTQLRHAIVLPWRWR